MLMTVRPFCSKPKFWFSRFRNAAVSRPDADNSTSESAAWQTTSVLRAKAPERCVDRFPPRSASMGSTRALIHAGATPNAIPVTSEQRNANASTGIEGTGLMGTGANPGGVANMKCRIRRVPTNATARPTAPPTRDKQNALREGLPHHARRPGAQRDTERGLLAARHASHQHEVRHVGAYNEQHKSPRPGSGCSASARTARACW